jgi:Zn finger protein HypA/HybF involved in hydrogenase expression
MNTVPTATSFRCNRCGGRVETCQGEVYCPDCTSFTVEISRDDDDTMAAYTCPCCHGDRVKDNALCPLCDGRGVLVPRQPDVIDLGRDDDEVVDLDAA